MYNRIDTKYNIVRPANLASHIYEDCNWFSGADTGEAVPILVRVFDTGDFHIELGNLELEEGYYSDFDSHEELIDFAWDYAHKRAVEEGVAYND